jgi:hypothetical protein
LLLRGKLRVEGIVWPLGHGSSTEGLLLLSRSSCCSSRSSLTLHQMRQPSSTHYVIGEGRWSELRMPVGSLICCPWHTLATTGQEQHSHLLSRYSPYSCSA